MHDNQDDLISGYVIETYSSLYSQSQSEKSQDDIEDIEEKEDYENY